MKARTRLFLIILVILGALATKAAIGKERGLMKMKSSMISITQNPATAKSDKI